MKNVRNLLRTLLLVLIASVAGQQAFAQCSIQLSGNQTEGCEPFVTTFTYTDASGKTVQSVAWLFGDGTGSSLASPSKIYQTSGLYTVTLTVTYSDGTTSNCNIQVRVWDTPKPNINLPSQPIQCFTNNQFCFTESSQVGADGNPIVSYLWNFGDGSTSTDRNPCHSYQSDGSYNVSLRVTDSKGCDTIQIRTLSITVLPDLKPIFTSSGPEQSCNALDATIVNKTDSNGMRITSWVWNWDDGTIVQGNASNWAQVKHTYTQKGTYKPTLTLTNSLGCTKTYTFDREFKVADIQIELEFDSLTCWKGNAVPFKVKPMDGFDGSFIWNFGDPNSGPRNFAFDWTTNHEFTAPGKYTVTWTGFNTLCNIQYDTCIVVYIKGPQAAIQPPPPPTIPADTWIEPIERPRQHFSYRNPFADPCLPNSGDTIIYTYFEDVPETITIPTYCNAPVTEDLDTTDYCDGTREISPTSAIFQPNGTRTFTYNKRVARQATWNRGDAYPWDMTPARIPYYSVPFVNQGVGVVGNVGLPPNPPGVPTRGAMYKNQVPATDRFVAAYKRNASPSGLNGYNSTCYFPGNLVQFSNNSMKYRLYNALDNVPYFGGLLDTCKFPFVHNFLVSAWDGDTLVKQFQRVQSASDSMQYLWLFNDGDNDTSTAANPCVTCMYSTEITPVHYFDPANVPPTGCQTVQLVVRDPVTGCGDTATLQLAHGAPNAWWDTTVTKKMVFEWGRVNPIEGPNGPIRRGFRLTGNDDACTGFAYLKDLDWEEVIPSGCPIQNFWITFDSAQTTTVKCTVNENGQQVQYLDHGWEGFTDPATGYDLAGPDPLWTNPLGWNNQYTWEEGRSGCMTVGVRIRNGDCISTAWYHNFICFRKLDSRFDIYQIDSVPVTRLRLNGKRDTIGWIPVRNLTGTSGGLVKVCTGGATADTNGITLDIQPRNVPLDMATSWFNIVQRREFPGGDDYYTKPFWPVEPTNEPFGFELDSLTSIQDTVFVADTSAGVYAIVPDENGGVRATVNLSFDGRFYLTKDEIATLNATNDLKLRAIDTLDYRTRRFSLYNDDSNPAIRFVTVKAAKLPIKVKDTLYILKLDTVFNKTRVVRDPVTGQTQIFSYNSLIDTVIQPDPVTGKMDTIAIKAATRHTLKYPGFYTIRSVVENVDRCFATSVANVIYGHFAKFWKEPTSDSIICVNTKVAFDHYIRYWTTQCINPFGPNPEGCIAFGSTPTMTGIMEPVDPVFTDAQGTPYVWNFLTVDFNPWDQPDVVAWRNNILAPGAPALTNATLPAGFVREKIEWDFDGDGVVDYTGRDPEFTYTEPGVYDVTMYSTDMYGCRVATTRKDFIKVINVAPGFVVDDTLKICAPQSFVFQDTSKLLGSEVDVPGKFGYKTRVKVSTKTSQERPQFGRGGRFTIAADYRSFEIKDTVLFVDSIVEWVWNPGDGRPEVTRTNSDTLVFDYKNNGRYDISLRLKTALSQCVEDLVKEDYIELRGPKPSFAILNPDDTLGCIPHVVNVTNYHDSGKTYQWKLTHADLGFVEITNSAPGQQDVQLTVARPGKYRLQLDMTEKVWDPFLNDSTECTITWPNPNNPIDPEFWIYVHGPDTVNIDGDTLVCPNQDVTYTLVGLDPTSDITWTLPNGQTGNGNTITTRFSDDDVNALQYIQVRTVSPDPWVGQRRCEFDTVLAVQVQKVRADFTIDTSRAYYGEFVFQNTTEVTPDLPGVTYTWDFGDGTVVNHTERQSISHSFTRNLTAVNSEEFMENKNYTVKLIATNANGCQDTIEQTINFERGWRWYNVITPNGDGMNDDFKLEIKGETMYDLKIYDRWGKKVFESESKDQVWDGTDMGGAPLPSGTYYYVWRFQLIGSDEEAEHKSTVTIIR